MAAVTFIHNATLIYKSAGGCRVLCDPWYTPGAFLTWTHVYDLGPYPMVGEDFDAIYISHAHEDHFDEQFLMSIPKATPLFIPEESLIPILRNKLTQLNFTNIRVCKNGTLQYFEDIKFVIYGPYQRSRFDDDGEFPNILDSSIFFDDGESTFLNTNDNFPTKSALEDLTSEFGKINCVGILYNSAGFYPHCVKNLSDQEKLIESDRIVGQCIQLISSLQLPEHCDYILPMAGDFRYQGASTFANKFIPISSPSDFSTTAQEELGLSIVNPGGFGVFDVASGQILSPGKHYQISDIRDFQDNTPTSRYTEAIEKIPAFVDINAGALSEKFNARLQKFDISSPYNFNVVDRNSGIKLFGYTNGSKETVDIYLDRLILNALITRELHWQNAWLGGLMEFWRTDHPHYNKDFYDLLSFLHY